MKNQKVVLRFDDHGVSDKYVLQRVQGTVTPGSMIRLIEIADLKANPREPKVGDVTEDIEYSLRETPELFQFKSKGILLSAGSCVTRERNRFELGFDDEDVEGVLDGGHNLLAIARHILRQALGEDVDRLLRGVRRWENVRDVWASNKAQIDKVRGEFKFLTPVEIVFPRDGADGRAKFENAILDVARARNNNAELTEETKANKSGFYEAIREALDGKLVPQVEWKTNDGGRIKVRDLVALSFVPLSRVPGVLPGIEGFKPVAMYANKGACVAAFNKLMESDKITAQAKGDIRELTHEGVKSALSLMADMPRLYDLIYSEFPDAYNASSPGFGRINSVYVWDAARRKSGDPKYLAGPAHTKFYRQECKYDYPDGFIMPLVWALSELIGADGNRVFWTEAPEKFLRKNLKDTLKVYQGLVEMAEYDPQKLGKSTSSYALAANDFRTRVDNND